MEIPPKSYDEQLRLRVLHELGILDTSAEERFDRLTRIAQSHFKVPISLVSLVDADRQWFKSRQGINISELARDYSICGHSILSDNILNIPDAKKDKRFFDNPLVVKPPNMRFYAGAPLRTPDGLRIGTLCILDTKPRHFSEQELSVLRDIADSVEHEINKTDKAALFISEQATYLKAVLDSVADGILTIDVTGKILSANRGSRDMFAFGKEAMIGLDITLLFSESNVAQFLDYFNAQLSQQKEKDNSGGSENTILEIKGKKQDGTIFPMELFITEVVNRTASQLICVVRDVSNRKNQENFLNTIIENIPNMIFVKDANTLKFTLINRAAEDLLGIPRGAMIGKTDFDLFPEAQAKSFVEKDREVLKLRQPVDISEEPLDTRNHGTRYLHTRKISVCDEQGEPHFLLGISEDITEKKILAEALFKQATQDALTNVNNRGSLYDFLTSEIKRAKRSQLRLACIYIDLDDFKPINDTHGHAVGDIVLVKVAQRLSQYVRESDCIARIGGDEFVIVLTDVKDVAQVESFKKRLSKDIEKSIETRYGNFSVSISMGVSFYPDDGEGMDELLQRADKLMYQDKKQRKNIDRDKEKDKDKDKEKE